MSSPRPVAPSSSTPATSVRKRMQRVQWMQRFMLVSTSGPKSLSATARLFSSIAAAVEAVGHRLVLQIALAALVADRAIERMVDQQESPSPPLRALLAFSDWVWITMPSAAGIAQDAIGFGDFSCLDQAHAAIAGDRQALVKAEMRDLDAGMLGRPAASSCPAGTSTSCPSIVSFGMALLRRLSRRRLRGIRRCAAPSPGGSGGSGLAPATPRRRPARRSCGLRSRW